MQSYCNASIDSYIKYQHSAINVQSESPNTEQQHPITASSDDNSIGAIVDGGRSDCCELAAQQRNRYRHRRCCCCVGAILIIKRICFCSDNNKNDIRDVQHHRRRHHQQQHRHVSATVVLNYNAVDCADSDVDNNKNVNNYDNNNENIDNYNEGTVVNGFVGCWDICNYRSTAATTTATNIDDGSNTLIVINKVQLVSFYILIWISSFLKIWKVYR